MNMFRELSPSEVEEFRASARANYKPLEPISGVWHPVYCAECVRMNDEEHGRGISEEKNENKW